MWGTFRSVLSSLLSNTVIHTDDALRDLVDRARQQPCVALDTEFVWERTYYANLGVVQVGWSRVDVHLVDAVVLDLAPLGDLLADANVEKVLHDAPQDLTLLHIATGALPQNVFDTRLAAGFAGLSSTLSLRRVLMETVGIDLPKTESRSDWLQRPLTDAQTAYALDDVRYLCEAAAEIKRRATKKGREAWMRDELSTLDSPDLYTERAPEDAFWRVKGMKRLRSREQSALRSLAAWREVEARRRNLPRGHVVSDDALVLVAQRKPRTADAAEILKGVPRRYAADLVAALEDGIERGKIDPPEMPPQPEEDETLGARIDLMLAYLKGRGLSEGVDPALVASRTDITDLARSDDPAQALLTGWRRDFMGDDLLKLLSGDLAVRIDPETGLPGRAG